jgi:hypothetical protein
MVSLDDLGQHRSTSAAAYETFVITTFGGGGYEKIIPIHAIYSTPIPIALSKRKRINPL